MNGAEQPAQQRWQSELGAWAIPDHIKQHASADPWHLDPALFRPAEPSPDTAMSLATQRAIGLLGDERSVLDVGCGGGAAVFAINPAPSRVHGVDQSEGMLELFASVAAERSIEHGTTVGSWLEVASTFSDGSFDVVVCHHVAYNVAQLGPFVAELRRVARNGVVMELTMTHPQTSNNPLWEQFWSLARPTGPSALDALAAITEHPGIGEAALEVGSTVATRQEPPFEARVHGALRMLCLGPDRFDEVADALTSLAPRSLERAVIVVR